MLAVDIIETHKQVWSQFILERVYFPVALSPSLSLIICVFVSVPPLCTCCDLFRNSLVHAGRSGTNRGPEGEGGEALVLSQHSAFSSSTVLLWLSCILSLLCALCRGLRPLPCVSCPGGEGLLCADAPASWTDSCCGVVISTCTHTPQRSLYSIYYPRPIQPTGTNAEAWFLQTLMKTKSSTHWRPCLSNDLYSQLFMR